MLLVLVIFACIFSPYSNVVTSLRECQAISSLASLRPSLRELILCHPDTNYDNYIKLQPLASEKKSGSSHPQDKCPLDVSGPLWHALCGLYNNSQLRAITSVIDIPRAMTTTAMMNASTHQTSSDKAGDSSGQEATPPYPLILLQGPPGTGYVCVFYTFF